MLALAYLPAAGVTRPLTLGVFPHLTPRQIITAYQPLVGALEASLGREVALVSAPDFKTFITRTRHGDYDIVLTAPHLAWLAREDAGYRPLLKYANPPRALLVVRADSSFDDLPALRGRAIATSDSIALAVMEMQSQLARHALERNRDYRVVEAGTHLNAAMQLIKGRADAAMVGLHPYELMPHDLRQSLRVIAETPPVSSLAYLTHPRLRDTEVRAVRRALLDFGATPAGRRFLRDGHYGAFAATDGHEIEAYRDHALRIRPMMQGDR